MELTTNSNLDINLKMSIQVSLNGLSFCILNSGSQEIKWYYKKDFDKDNNPVKILETIEKIYSEQKILTSTFEEVIVLFSNDLYSLVPREYFLEDEASNYLKFNTKILKTDVVAFDEISLVPINCVYIPYINITNYFFDKYGEHEYKHSITQLIDSLLKYNQPDENLTYINTHNDYYDLVVFKKGEFVLANTFHYESLEDFIYYLLFTLEQLKLDPETIKLYFLGTISKDSEFFKITYKYIKNVELLEPQFKINQASYDIASFKREAFLLLNSLGCE